MKTKIIDVIQPNIQFSITEASEVDGQHVLAKVKGEFFVPDGESRNKRFYPLALWQKIIESSSVKQKLKDKLMFGTVGHDGEIGDKGVREGLISHVMTNIMIENGKGIGEAIILNTPTGRILNTLLRAGCNLRVSSRANGAFKGEHNGMPVVDPDSYDLEGWDFVIEAGFLQANPSIAESLNSLQKNVNSETILKTDNCIGESMSEKTMDAKLVEHIVNENAELKKNISKLTEELEAVEADKEKLESEVEADKAEKEEVAEKLKKLAKYEELGEPEELEKKLEEDDEEEKELEEYRELGDSPEEVKEALLSAQKHLTFIREQFGTVPEIKKALVEAINFRKQVDAIGTVSEIKESLSAFKKIVEEGEQAEADAKAQGLADELGLSLEEVKELLSKNSEDEIRSMYAKVAEAFAKKTGDTRFVKKAPQTIVEAKTTVNEEKTTTVSRLDRINERLSR